MVSPVALPHAAAGSQGYEAMRRHAVEMEGVFLHTLVKEMFSSIDSKGTFGGGFAEETWRGMQGEQLAGAMAEAGGIGLADAILADLLSIQENAASHPDAKLKGAYK